MGNTRDNELIYQIVGDGDCGETCASGAQAVLQALKSDLGSDGDVVELFRELTDIIDGAYGVFLLS